MRQSVVLLLDVQCPSCDYCAIVARGSSGFVDLRAAESDRVFLGVSAGGMWSVVVGGKRSVAELSK